MNTVSSFILLISPPIRHETCEALLCLEAVLVPPHHRARGLAMIAVDTKAVDLALVIPWYYLSAMKVAISLPDPVFSAAEKLAHRMRVSRSQLYAQAIEEYLGKRQDTLVTERLNAVYASEQSPIDPAMAAAQLGAIGHEAW